MNLMSLPNEMLASVLKYSTDKSLRKSRRLSHRIDAIAKNNKMNLLNLSSLRISCLKRHDQQDNNLLFIKREPVLRFYNRKNSKKISGGSYTKRAIGKRLTGQQLEKILYKIRKAKHVVLASIIIDEAVLAILTKYANILKNSSIHITRCKIEIPPMKLKIFANLAKLSNIILAGSRFSEGDTLTDEIIIGFNSSMKVELHGMYATLTAKSFHGRVHSNKLNLSILWMKTSITFKDMIKLVKTSENIENEMQFGTIQDVPDEVENVLYSEFENCEVIQKQNTYSFQPYAGSGIVYFQSTFED